MSKELAFALTAVAMITGATAAAADEYIAPRRAQAVPPATAPPPAAPPPVNNWAGPFVGVAGGFAWGRSNQTDAGFFIPPGSERRTHKCPVCGNIETVEIAGRAARA